MGFTSCQNPPDTLRVTLLGDPPKHCGSASTLKKTNR